MKSKMTQISHSLWYMKPVLSLGQSVKVFFFFFFSKVTNFSVNFPLFSLFIAQWQLLLWCFLFIWAINANHLTNDLQILHFVFQLRPQKQIKGQCRDYVRSGSVTIFRVCLGVESKAMTEFVKGHNLCKIIPSPFTFFLNHCNITVWNLWAKWESEIVRC